MDSKGMALMAIAVVAMGTFALPNTVSLFSGQHTWYDLGAKGNDVPCEKCHADIAEEMDAGIGPHTGETGYGRFECEYCHRVFPIKHKNASFVTYTYASGDGTGAEPGKEAHAASTVACMYCHSGSESGIPWLIPGTMKHGVSTPCTGCHDSLSSYPHAFSFTDPDDCLRCHANKTTQKIYYVPPAGGFNLTTNSTDTGERAAHKTFVMNAISNPDMEDANEACIACHTHIAVKINWTHRYSLEFNASFEDGLYPPTHFNVSDWKVNGTVNVTVYGNGSGGGSTSGWP
ncbi:MAG: cytochrome c3 family protein [Halobacteriota archaeon]